MADYSHSHTDRLERTERRHGHAGLILTGIALLMLAALAWVWTEGSSPETAQPQAQSTVSQQAPAKATAVAAEPAAPAPVVAQTVAQAPVAQPAATSVLMPPSDAVAAAGDTRAAR